MLRRQTNQAKAVVLRVQLFTRDYRVARAAFLVAGKRVTSDPGLSSPAETGILGGCRPAAKHSIGDVDIAAAISGRDGQEMIERDVKVTGRSGAIPSFAVCPDGPGPFPGIILYMDAPGIHVEELRNLARRYLPNAAISACCRTCTTGSARSALTSCAEARACGRPCSRRQTR